MTYLCDTCGEAELSDWSCDGLPAGTVDDLGYIRCDQCQHDHLAETQGIDAAIMAFPHLKAA